MRLFWLIVVMQLFQAEKTLTTIQTTTHTDGAVGLEHACKFRNDLTRRNRALDGLYFVDLATLEEFKIMTGRWVQGEKELTYYFEVGSSVPENKQVDVAAIKFHFTEHYKAADETERRLTRKNTLIRHIGAFSGRISNFTGNIRRDEENEKVIFWNFRKLISKLVLIKVAI